MTAFTSGWHVTGASVTGTSHLRTKRICDDAHAYRVYEQDLLFVAVADGAGSATQAATGAALAVQAAITGAEILLLEQVEPADQNQWLSVLTHILTFAHEALATQASSGSSSELDPPDFFPQNASNGNLLRAFATTLLVAIVSAHWIAVVQIGDGTVVIQQGNGSLVSLTPPSQREYINETDFLTDTAYLQLAQYTTLPRADITGIALLTDGLELLAMNAPAHTPHQPFFTPLFKFAATPTANAEALAQFLTSERICSRTDDDKTLVLAVHQ